MSRGWLGSLREKPVCWTEGMLPQDGCVPRRGSHPSLTVAGIACEGYLPWCLYTTFFTDQGFVQPGEAEAPGQNWGICPGLVLQPQLGSTSGWVSGLDQQLQNPLARRVCTKWRAGNPAFALTYLEYELFSIRAWRKPLLYLGYFDTVLLWFELSA